MKIPIRAAQNRQRGRQFDMPGQNIDKLSNFTLIYYQYVNHLVLH